MTKLFKLLGLNKPVAGEYGIEIECEGKNIQAVDTRTWNSEPDGSLRGVYPNTACEFVLKKPIMFGAVEKALDELIEHEKDAEFDFSFRTSVHIHVNVQELTSTQLYNLIYTYLLIEQPLVNYCGDSRKGNRFCLRLRDAEGMVDVISNLFRTGNSQLRRIPGDTMRYASINLEAFKKYGSIEFRAMRGTMDKAIILPWIQMLHSIKLYACEVANPKQVHEDFRAYGSVGFLNKVIGPENAQRVMTPTSESEMNESYSLSIDLPYSFVEPVEEAEAPKEEILWDKLVAGGGARPGDLQAAVIARRPAMPRVRIDDEVRAEPINPEIGARWARHMAEAEPIRFEELEMPEEEQDD